MIRRVFLCAFAVTALTLLAASNVSAQTTDQQTFTVTVPTLLSIAAPANQSLTLNTSSDPKVFAGTPWHVFCNTSAGANFQLTAQSRFVHTTVPAIERDAQLDLAFVAGSGSPGHNWAVVAASSDTIATGTAQVSGRSDRPGSADFNLTVTFLDSSFDDLPAGVYTMTVEGLISAN